MEEESNSPPKPASALGAPTDPFAARTGPQLEWRQLELQTKKSANPTLILNKVSGTAQPGHLTCIMGVSGSGKTSLLEALSGRSAQYKLEGDIYLDGTRIDPSSPHFQNRIAYIGQNDKLLPTATPRESIRFAARLRLPRATTEEEVHDLVDRILEELRLTEVADHLIGGDLVKSLSGGEMRRVSLGVQLGAVPTMLFLDEITSGLDSRNAAVVMEVCKNVAAAGTTMLVVIHQPSSIIFAMMDHLIILDHGRTMYQGPADCAIEYFARRGHPMPENYNPADWVFQVSLDIPEESLFESGFFRESDASTEQDQEQAPDPELEVQSADLTVSPTERLDTAVSRATIWTQTVEQLRRDLKTLYRDSNGLLLRLLCVGASSVLTAISFTNVGENSTENPIDFSSHVGAIFFLLLGSSIIMQLVLFDFIEVRDLCIRELRTNQYGIVSFGFAKVTIETFTTLLLILVVVVLVYWSLALQGRFWYFFLVLFCLTMVNTSMSFLLGAVPEDPRNAKEFIALLILPQLLFSGFFVDPESLPVWISWICYLMPTFYAFKLVLADEFSTCMDFDGIESHVLDCVESLTNALRGVRQEGISFLFSEDVKATLAEVGLFKGKEASLEHLFFVNDKVTPTTLLPTKCTIDGTNSLWIKNSSPGHCEILGASVQQAKLNPSYAKEEYADAPLVNYVEGLKITFDPDEDLQSIRTNQLDVYISQGFFTSLIGEQFEPARIAEHICETLEEFCPTSWEKDGFSSRDDCVSHMEALPLATVNDRGQTVLDGNSTGCRFVHSTLARKRGVHCPHISFLPEEDNSGAFKCHESNNMAADDIFDDEDKAIFALLAAEQGLNTTLQARSASTDPSFGDLSQREQCQGDSNVEGVFRNVELPSNYFCSEFLRSQDATGEHDMEYWIILVGLYVGIRSLSLYVLRARARGQLCSQRWTS